MPYLISGAFILGALSTAVWDLRAKTRQKKKRKRTD